MDNIDSVRKNVVGKLPLFVMLQVAVLSLYYFFVRENLPQSYRGIVDVLVFATSFSGMTAYIALKVNAIANAGKVRKIKWLEERLQAWNTITYRVRGAGETAFNKLPIGIVVYNDELEITWANQYAQDAFSNILIEREIKTIHHDLHRRLVHAELGFMIDVYNKKYDVLHNAEEKVLYLFEVTSREKLLQKYNDRIPAIAVMQLDNYENAMSTLDVQDRAEILSKYLSKISQWYEEFNIFVQGFNEYKFICLMDKAQLDAVQAENFSIVDAVREVSYENGLAITLSIGVSCEDTNMESLGELAHKSLSIALSRGGDQVVCNTMGEFTYYGGKTNTIAKKDKIRARVISEELYKLIEESTNVIIMGHSYPDTDAFGACLGLLKMAKSSEVNCHIVLDSNKLEPTVKKIINKAEREHIGLLSYLIDPREALNEMTDDTLLIVVDCHKKDMTIEPRLVDRAKRLAVIDHHRRTNNVIENAQLFYVEPYSSSSVELVAEMMQFYPIDIAMSHYESTLLLAGLIVDTNNFTYRTSTRTFDVASYLKNLGADTVKVKTLLREEYDIYKNKNAILSNLEIYNEIYSIVKIPADMVVDRTTLAQIVDEALTISDIQAAFGIGMIDGKTVGIAARSYGDQNVQVIMEKMGGGGHLNNAASQIKDVTIDKVYEDLKTILDKYGEKSDTMRVILLKEIKGKGKEGDIIDVAVGYGNFLLTSKQAIEATLSNIKNVEEKHSKEVEEAKKILLTQKKLKEKIEANPVIIGIKIGQNGKPFGKISSKQIVEEYEAQHNIKLDRKKIIINNEIETLGVHKVTIQLHKEVLAEIEIQVIEA